MNAKDEPIKSCKLSIVIPCFNEENTLSACVDNVLEIANNKLELEIIIVDDASSDRSFSIAKDLAANHNNISYYRHENNQGKGAALRTGFQMATGDFVAVQDADLEYDPQDLKRLLVPLLEKKADVVFGSRFLSIGAHRVLYFWHSLGNKLLTLLSNIFTDMTLTDMETCYKVFRREVIQSITIEENRFGFEPEIVAKVAHQRLRIYEMGISYDGRTYSEGKKIGYKDGLRAIYCILRYNAPTVPLPVQLMLYSVVEGLSALVNLSVFTVLYKGGLDVMVAASVAFVLAALSNYILCISVVFRHNAQWSTLYEIIAYTVVVLVVGLVDLKITEWFVVAGSTAAYIFAVTIVVVLNYLGRKYLVFREKPSGEW
ncbi:MAG: bifunctional glycosyltransferase family 2/GtrA family protein [Magnetococcales bacterium]|nr:bifunctional glycosyltransferase family 2/GtrA family protein [Magnetococcales bacterium]